MCATRDEDELKNCIPRGVLVLAPMARLPSAISSDYRVLAARRAYVGLGVGRGWEEMATRLATHRDEVVWMDAASLNDEGPHMAAQLNTLAPAVKVIVVGSSLSPWEPAYRSQRVFYYAVEPFDKPEIVEVLHWRSPRRWFAAAERTVAPPWNRSPRSTSLTVRVTTSR